MMAEDKRNSNVQLLQEPEALNETLFQSHTTNRTRMITASLALPRQASSPFVSSKDDNDTAKVNNKQSKKTRSRGMSLSPWRSKPKLGHAKATLIQPDTIKFDETTSSVVTAQGLPSSMNGLRLSVCVRKKETKDGSVQTMPSRVDQGAADFEEIFFIRCHVYCNRGSGKQLKFEPRPFLIYLVAVDAKELGFGRNCMDLSQLVQESFEKSQEGKRVKQWNTSFGLSGKAKGGELILKLGVQIMEKDGEVHMFSQEENFKSGRFRKLASFVRQRSKSSFSFTSPRIRSRSDA
ncbi:hypothetical protein V8G54_011151 [Vigna mungo]|uniref:C2 NT-type domain-containing protein n=1 Tax=Vigna mungo TaxID=3915 RepID=A0AAQ3NQX4_VIGMU